MIDETCPRCKGWVWHRAEPCNCKPVKCGEYDLSAMGRRLKACREAQRLSLDELAVRARMSKAGLWDIEQGNHEPKAFTLIALADALSVSVDFLLLRE